jgi:hypothetical protein
MPSTNKPILNILSDAFTSQSEKLAYAHALIEQERYSEARKVLETMPFNDLATDLLGELGQLELMRQKERQRQRTTYQTPAQMVSIRFAMLMLLIGLLMGGVGGFFFGREMLVREIGYALGSAFESAATDNPLRLSVP